MSFLLRITMVSAVLLFLSGCSAIYKPTAWIVYDYTEDHAIPYTLTSDDPGMVCGLSEALAPGLLSFSTVAYTPNKAAITMYMMAGTCAEELAQEEALTYLRALKAHNVDEAKDARIREKRHFAVAAQRQYAAYRHMVDQYIEPGDACPKLKKKDEVYWVMGNLAGVQAVMSDMRAQNVVNVPKDIAMKAVRGMQCVNNERWWGLPQAAQASIAIMMPDSSAGAADPWVAMEAASEMASVSGVRMAHAIEVMVADSTGHEDRLKNAIRRHADAIKTTPSLPAFRLMDLVASRQILAVSDRMWTEATGSRTPIEGLGTFWDDVVDQGPMFDIDDLLGD